MMKFQVGQSYDCRSACDYDCRWTYTVVSRTAKFVTLREESGEVVRVGVRSFEGVEYCSPQGRFSMSPSLAADRVAVG